MPVAPVTDDEVRAALRWVLDIDTTCHRVFPEVRAGGSTESEVFSYVAGLLTSTVREVRGEVIAWPRSMRIVRAELLRRAELRR
jgi:hypothetical protein